MTNKLVGLKIDQVKPLYAVQSSKPVKLRKKCGQVMKDILGIGVEDCVYELFFSVWELFPNTDEALIEIRYFLIPLTVDNLIKKEQLNIISDSVTFKNGQTAKDFITALYMVFDLTELDILSFGNKKLKNADEYEKILKKWRISADGN